MSKNVKVKAELISKYCIENFNAPLTGYGVIFAYADSSRSFMTKDIQYMVSFMIGVKMIEFQIEKSIFDRLEEGTRGWLIYDGKKFIEFEKESVL